MDVSEPSFFFSLADSPRSTLVVSRGGCHLTCNLQPAYLDPFQGVFSPQRQWVDTFSFLPACSTDLRRNLQNISSNIFRSFFFLIFYIDSIHASGSLGLSLHPMNSCTRWASISLHFLALQIYSLSLFIEICEYRLPSTFRVNVPIIPCPILIESSEGNGDEICRTAVDILFSFLVAPFEAELELHIEKATN